MNLSDSDKAQLSAVADQLNEIMPDLKQIVYPVMDLLYNNKAIKELVMRAGAQAIAAQICQGLGPSALAISPNVVADQAVAIVKSINAQL
jgi:hypothetical protein